MGHPQQNLLVAMWKMRCICAPPGEPVPPVIVREPVPPPVYTPPPTYVPPTRVPGNPYNPPVLTRMPNGGPLGDRPTFTRAPGNFNFPSSDPPIVIY